MKVNLRVPGPTPVPGEVAQAGARPMINHRGPEFARVMGDVVEGLKPFFGTASNPLLLTGSGTGVLEAAVVNMLSPGDQVLSVTIGAFGDRFADIADAFGASVHRLEVDWGNPAEAGMLEQALSSHDSVKAVLITHNETSTGVANDLPQLMRVIRSHPRGGDALVVVDGVSSIGAMPFEMDEWGVDLALSGSQKGWMSPPGIAMAALSERAWAAHARATMPRYYWDFTRAEKFARKGTAPFTPAVSVVRALQKALELMGREGKEAIFVRHRRLAERIRVGASDLGFRLFADPRAASDTVTALNLPSSIDGPSFIRDLREQHQIVVASGQGRLSGSIFRIGHLGSIDDHDVDHLLEGLGTVSRAHRVKELV